MMRKLHLTLFKNKKTQNRKHFIFLFLILLCSNSRAQNTTNLAEGHTFNTKTISSDNSQIPDILISWDFTQVNKKEQLSLTIEVQPLNACWNKLNGSNRSEKITRNIKGFSENYKSNLTLGFSELNSKCFKWRAKIDTNSETNYTEWQFSSFL